MGGDGLVELFEALFESFPLRFGFRIFSEFPIFWAGKERGELFPEFFRIFGIELGKSQLREFFRDFPLGDTGHYLGNPSPLR